MHGGLSPSLKYAYQVEGIDRNHEIPYEGMLTDMIWSDPDEKCENWNENPRGMGFTFGELPSKKV